MNYESIHQSLERLNADRVIQNLIAQANARYILLNTAEDPQNFPPYTIDNDRLNILALQYLNLGCGLAENQRLEDAVAPLEKGANLLETIHGSPNNKQGTSDYYGLIAALSHYVSFQYSKSFILVRKFAAQTTIAALIRYFLIRDFARLNELIYLIVVSVEHEDAEIAQNIEKNGSLNIYEIVIAKALSGYVGYLQSGDKQTLEVARAQFQRLKEIAELENDPGIWWVIRLLLLISSGFAEASVWNVLAVHFDIEDENVDGYLKGLVFMPPNGIYELFITQRKSLAKVLNYAEKGCIVSIPTSSGKTRIAEIAILDCIIKNPTCKVLYIAPFRSLAFEIENSMERVFENTTIRVSHLYGGSSYSTLDQAAIDEAAVVIATPEKAKAILRGNPDFIKEVRLVVIDEGHLLGDNKRLIVNEIFYEELRYYIEGNSGRFLLLSAVLPNAEDLALWLTESDETVYKEKWRPSDERLGILEWNNGSVNLNWESQDQERASFNNKFITAIELPRVKYQRKDTIKYYPADKNEAVAATAYRLRNFGPVLIFVGVKASVFVMARAYLKALGDAPADHEWKQRTDWRAFEMACIETYGEEQGYEQWLHFARKGILCHNSDLHADVRLPLERLMRADRPLVIISTSTLGQGVNLGVSTVIFSTLYQSGELINARDFWNIAGRAGRAFVDHEGKILVATDTNGKSNRDRRREFGIIKKYFDKDKIDIAHSGVLAMILKLKNLAAEAGVNFSLLLELISENRLDEMGGGIDEVEEKLDWIDDTLLSLLLEHNPEGDLDIAWTEAFFSRSLAVIQAANETAISQNNVLQFLNSRVAGIFEKVGADRTKWSSIVKSGIPLNSDLILEDRLDGIIEIVQHFEGADPSVDNYITLLKALENEIIDLPVIVAESSALNGLNIDLIREQWLRGVPISAILKLEMGLETITKLYTFILPWVLNGIAKKIRNRYLEEEAEWVENLAILVEAGLPSLLKVKVYQAGIRSRVAADEIGNVLEQQGTDGNMSSLKRELILNAGQYTELVSEISGEWLDLMSNRADRKLTKVKRVTFTFEIAVEHTKVLLARSINGEQYLISPDFKYIYKGGGNLDFSEVNNVSGIEFRYKKKDKEWKMYNSNPYWKIIK